MPAKKTLQSLRVRGPLRLDGSVTYRGIPLANFAQYQALLSQDGENAPEPHILSNTLSGNPVWSRVGVGSYRLTLAGAFPEGKTVCVPPNFVAVDTGDQMTLILCNRVDSSTIAVSCFSTELVAKELQMSETTLVLFEVRIYD